MKRLIALAVALALPVAPCAAQPEPVAPTRAPQADSACRATTGRELGTSLPLDVLDYLDRASSSVFVHAFLVHYMASSAAREHWMRGCAERFLATPLHDIERLRARRIGTDLMLHELREAETVRLDVERRRAEAAPTIQSLARDLIVTPTAQAVAAYLPHFDTTRARACPRRAPGFCDAVWNAVERLRQQAERHQAVDTAKRTADNAQQALAKLDDDISSLLKGEADDATRLAEARSSEDSAAVKARITERQATLATTRARRDTANMARNSADSTVAFLDRQLTESTVALRVALGTLASVQERRETVRLSAPERTAEAYANRAALAEQAPTTVVVHAEVAGAPNVMLALTDFVIDRAKQELVLAYLGSVYAWFQGDTLLQLAFPETYRLMGTAASGSSPGTFSVVAAGRIPLETWRATLTTDYNALPLNLLGASPSLVCGQKDTCRQRLVTLEPIALAARRLLAGDPMLDVLRELPSTTLSRWPNTRPLLVRVRQGLVVLAALAETYRVQGLALSHDIRKYPYLLSLDALNAAPRGQRDALARLLVLRIAEPATAPTMSLQATALLDSVAHVVRHLEALVSVVRAEEPTPAQAARLVHHAFAGLQATAGVARALADSNHASIDSVLRRWEALGRAVEPLVARQFGLALARTASLLRDVSDSTLPRSVFTLSALATGLAEATDGDQVRAAFEAAAAPVGGWRAKRHREGGRFSITAFPGATGGCEWLSDQPFWHHCVPAAGMTLPIGIDWQLMRRSGPHSASARCAVVCSVGLFAPLIDLGALLNYRLRENTTVTSDPDPSLRQVFAPGAFVALGVNRTPITVLWGVQFMPQLREVKTGSASESRSAYRIAFAASLDVVLFDLWR